MPKAAIFDLDGTLLDSVDLHALAWADSLVEFGHDVSFEEVRSQIGKGGDKLIPVFLSADEQRDYGEELKRWRGDHFKARYLPLVRPFSAVPELLQRVRHAGLRIAIASSVSSNGTFHGGARLLNSEQGVLNEPGRSRSDRASGY